MNQAPLPQNRDDSTDVETKEKVDGPSKSPLLVALAFLMLVLLSTGYFAWSNYNSQKLLEKIQAEKAEYDSKIQALKANPDILAAEVLLTKESEIKKNIEQSNPAIYLRELERIYKSKGVMFEGFTYSKGKVTTRLIAQSGSDDDAVKKVIALIAEYRNSEATSKASSAQNSVSNSQATEAAPSTASGSNETPSERLPSQSNTPSIFSLGPIMSVSGDSGERTVNIEFTIK